MGGNGTGTERGLERLVFFTDAVTAIAITLLILPLVDSVPVAGGHGTAAAFLGAHLEPIFAFVLSFAIIARMWVAHHSIFEHVERYTPALLWLTLAWTFTIVALPLPTAMVAAYPPTASTIGLYIGIMSASSILLTSLSWVVYRTRDLDDERRRLPSTRLVGSAMTSAIFLVALLLGVLVPWINYYGLFLLFLTIPGDAIVARRLRRTRPAHARSSHR